jgi:hypothetical protein
LANNIRGYAIQAGIQTPTGKSLTLIGEALETIQNTHDSLIKDANTTPNPQHEVSVQDETGHEVAFLGFKSAAQQRNYGLNVFDPAKNPAAFLGVMTEPPLAITATTNASPDVISIAGHPYVNGETLIIQGALGDTAINGFVIVENVVAGVSFQITDLIGNPVNGNGAYTGGGTATRYLAGVQAQSARFGPNNQVRIYPDGTIAITSTHGGLTISLDPSGGLLVNNNIFGTQGQFTADAAKLSNPSVGSQTQIQPGGQAFGRDGIGGTWNIAPNAGFSTSPSAGLLFTLGPAQIKASGAGGHFAEMLPAGTADGFDGSGAWSITGTSLSLHGSQVVGQRGAAVTDVVGTAGATYTATEQAMINSLVNQLNSALARLRAHGLIAP